MMYAIMFLEDFCMCDFNQTLNVITILTMIVFTFLGLCQMAMSWTKHDLVVSHFRWDLFESSVVLSLTLWLFMAASYPMDYKSFEFLPFMIRLFSILMIIGVYFDMKAETDFGLMKLDR